MKDKLNYSLQIASDRSFAKDEEERNEFLEALENRRVINPNQLVFVDESQKDRNSTRRRRSWARRGLTPFCQSYLAKSDGKRYGTICSLQQISMDSYRMLAKKLSNLMDKMIRIQPVCYF